MLTSQPPDSATDALSVKAGQPPVAKPARRGRRWSLKGLLARRQAAVHKSQVATERRQRALLAGVDAFGKVTHWSVFNQFCRNDRRVHQQERASREHDSDMTAQQAELAADVARARMAHQSRRHGAHASTGPGHAQRRLHGIPAHPAHPRGRRKSLRRWPKFSLGAASKVCKVHLVGRLAQSLVARPKATTGQCCRR